MHVPHRCRITTTSTGIRIGAAYIPPPPRPTPDQEHVQAALLEPRTLCQQSALQQIVGRVMRWL